MSLDLSRLLNASESSFASETTANKTYQMQQALKVDDDDVLLELVVFIAFCCFLLIAMILIMVSVPTKWVCSVERDEDGGDDGFVSKGSFGDVAAIATP